MSQLNLFETRPREILCSTTFVWLLVSCLLSGSWTAAAEVAESTADQDSEVRVDEILSEIAAAQRDLRSLEAVVTRTKESELLAEQAEASGMLMFKRPSNLYIRLGPEDPIVASMTRQRAVFYYPDLQEAEIFSLSRYQDQMHLMQTWMEDPAELAETYDVRLLEDDAETVTLGIGGGSESLPRSDTNVRATFRTSDWYPIRIVIETDSGERATYELSELTTDVDIEDSAFDLTFPEQVKVRRHQ